MIEKTAFGFENFDHFRDILKREEGFTVFLHLLFDLLERRRVVAKDYCKLFIFIFNQGFREFK